ncbi:MAG: ferredoxin [Mycobacterium sp.]|uniref:ferredoxin n=1 Tax=Mycobacterium sp. TaxID=1785 RepID=UPI001EC014AE|nr:ferredoxin [Mycobacterium sp.]MBV8785846.1 ferredoxin [Mycobacterium sp.]
MTFDSSAGRDNRLDEMPMSPVTCRNCGARVLARKSTWNQTSVQWNADASARCAERAEAQKMSAHADRGVFLACAALGESITDAVRCGDLTIVDERVGAAL